MMLSDGCLRCHSRRDLEVLEGDPDAVPERVIISVAYDAIDHWSSEQWRFLCRRLTPTLQKFEPHYADLASWPDDGRRATEEAMAVELTYALEHWARR